MYENAEKHASYDILLSQGENESDYRQADVDRLSGTETVVVSSLNIMMMMYTLMVKKSGP